MRGYMAVRQHHSKPWGKEFDSFVKLVFVQSILFTWA